MTTKMTFEAEWREISPYLDEALVLEGEAREHWLKALDLSAPAIAQRVRADLAQLEALEGNNFLGDSVVQIPTASLAGQQFGAYTLDIALGHGGMGSVWRAHRNDGRFEGLAAVKLLSPTLVGHPSERRFVREGNVLARLQHPNISRLLDAGVAGGSQPYLILEYVDGEHIDLYCEQRQLDLHQRITLFLDVLGAVAHAHSHLIVHRDIKPSNILVTANGTVKLLDFGVAALLSPSAERVTQHAAVGLTLGYAAPEQLRGEPVTTATDVYALGRVLFLLLARCHPFSLEDTTPAQLMQATLEGEVPRPSAVAADPRHARLLRGDLDNIITMALRRNPAERYATVDQFAQDLRRYLTLQPVTARASSFGYLAGMFVRRHRAVLTLAALVVVILIGAVAVTTTQMLDARRQRAEAQRQRDEAKFEARRAEATNQFLDVLMLTDPDPGSRPMTSSERLELGVDLLDKQYRDDPKFAGRMLITLALDYVDKGEARRANELYEKAYDMGRRTHDLELMAQARCERIYSDAVADIRDGLEERRQEAQRLLAEMREADPILQVKCMKAQAFVERQRGKLEVAESLLRRALQILEAHGSTHPEIYVDILSNLGGIELSRNRPRETLRMMQRAGEILDRSGRGGTTTRLHMHQNAAVTLTYMGEVSAALAERKIVIERNAEIRPSGHEALVYPVNYAIELQRMARPDEALRVLDGVTERARRYGNPYMVASALLADGWTFIQLGRWREADAALAEAASLVASGLGERSMPIAIESAKAQLDLARGALESAHRHSDRALELAGYRTQKRGRELAAVLRRAAQIALAEGASAQAEQLARDALAISEPIARGPDTSADVGEALLRLAQAQMLAGTQSGTRALLERAVRCLSNGLAPDHPLTVEARKLLTRLSVETSRVADPRQPRSETR